MKLSERFINAINEDSIISGKNAHAIEDAINFIRKYEDAEEQGRLVILPCKVGETVWRIATCRIDLTGYRMEWGEQRIIEGVPFHLSMLDAFGKTVFLTRAEAEAAFKREQDDG